MVKTIDTQLHEAIEALKDEINRHGFCVLKFTIHDWQFRKFEKEFDIDYDEIEGIEIKDKD